MNFRECDLVGDLVYGQEGVPQTHQSALEISRNTEICQSAVGSIVHDLFRDIQPSGRKQQDCSVADTFSGSVATQLR